MTILTPEQIANFPVQHISVSSIRQYLTCRQAFFKRYVRLEFESKKGPALIEGSLFHSILELYWQDHKEGKQAEFSVENAFESRLQQFEIDNAFDDIDWGKEGSKEKSIATVKQALGFYFLELPNYTTEQVFAIEERFLSDFEDLEGNSMPIPLKGFLDLIVTEAGDYIIEDHKLVSKITQQEELAPAYIIQACEYWFLTRKTFGINPKRMIFRQTKKTKNTFDGTIEDLEALFEVKGLEFTEISEKTQLIDIFAAEGITEVIVPETTKQIADLGVTEIKNILTEAGIEFKKSGKKDELIAACSEAGITEAVFPEKKVEVASLKAKEIKEFLIAAQIPINTKGKKQQMVEFGIEQGVIVLPPQVVPYVVEYTSEMLEVWLELYRRIVKELSGQPLIDENTGIVQFLPNPYASFGAEESWLDFAEEVTSGKCWTLDEIRSIKPNKFEEYVDALDL